MHVILLFILYSISRILAISNHTRFLPYWAIVNKVDRICKEKEETPYLTNPDRLRFEAAADTSHKSHTSAVIM